MANEKFGSIQVSNQIVEQIVAESALKTNGVYKVIGYANQKFEKYNKDALSISDSDGEKEITICIVVNSDSTVIEVAENVQKNIASEIYSMLRLNVNKINVIVKSIHYVSQDWLYP